jgi:hypothetical protein
VRHREIWQSDEDGDYDVQYVEVPFHTARFDIVLARDQARSARTWSNRR